MKSKISKADLKDLLKWAKQFSQDARIEGGNFWEAGWIAAKHHGDE